MKRPVAKRPDVSCQGFEQRVDGGAGQSRMTLMPNLDNEDVDPTS